MIAQRRRVFPMFRARDTSADLQHITLSRSIQDLLMLTRRSCDDKRPPGTITLPPSSVVLERQRKARLRYRPGGPHGTRPANRATALRRAVESGTETWLPSNKLHASWLPRSPRLSSEHRDSYRDPACRSDRPYERAVTAFYAAKSVQ